MEQLQKSKSIVALIDILGFKEIVKANNKLKDNSILLQLQNALEQSFNKAILLTQDWIKSIAKVEDESLMDKLKYRQFSDNLYFSFDYNDDNSDYELAVYFVTIMSAYYQRIMFSKNFYVRGGIADGQNFFDKNMIFSSALIKAYEIETKTAKYPRIIIDNSILKKLNQISGKENFIKILYPKLIVKDWTGLSFLNPFIILDSLITLINDHPEIIPVMEQYATDNPSLKGNDLNLEPDISDTALKEIVLNNLKIKLKKHKKDTELFEKYLWLKVFVIWQKDKKNNLNFKYH